LETREKKSRRFESPKNKESKNIAKIKKEGGDIKAQLDKVKKISNKINDKATTLKEIEENRDSALIKIPNLLDKEVPVGKDDEENVPIRFHLKKPEYSFKIKNHQELCELNDWYDLEMAAKNSGARFYYLKGDLVMLELALHHYVMDKFFKNNYTPIEVPPMLRRDAIGKSVSLEDFEEVIYKIEGEDLYMIGTSEHALAGMHANQLLNHKDLPKNTLESHNALEKKLE